MTDTDQDVRDLLPLTPTVFHILLSLSDGARHGYWIMQAVTSQSDGRVGLGPGTMYGAIDRMVGAGLIESAPAPEGAKSEKRRRYYRMTELGREALLAESDRMAALVLASRPVRTATSASHERGRTHSLGLTR